MTSQLISEFKGWFDKVRVNPYINAVTTPLETYHVPPNKPYPGFDTPLPNPPGVGRSIPK
jgi:hypothetical protein